MPLKSSEFIPTSMSLIQRSCPFNSLGECLSFLAEHFPRSTTEIQNATGQNPDGSQITGPRRVPRYLFRGEKEKYPTCRPAICRVNDLGPDDKAELIRVVEEAVAWFRSNEFNFGLSSPDAEGLVQHLGLPTRYLDFSSDPDIAAAFGVGDFLQSCRPAAICVLDVQKAIESECAQIAEYKDHPWCERAKRQAAYGFAPLSFSDLRLPQATDQAGLWWFDVTIQATDIDRFHGKFEELLDPSSDPVSGLLRFVTNLYVARNGKLGPAVASWISKKIPMVPILVNRNSSEEVEFLRPGGLQRWSEEREREMSLRYWSKDFQGATLPPDYVQQIGRGCGMFLFPCTYHPEE
jgi:hypothetical protein